jgi:hypothetical protein
MGAHGQTEIEHGRTDTDEHLTTVGVECGELAAPVDEHVDGVAPWTEQPRLRVVHRRGGGRCDQAKAQHTTGVAVHRGPGGFRHGASLAGA